MFSPLAAELIASPTLRGALAGASHVGHGGNPGDGPYISLYLRCEGDLIAEAQFESNGCPSSIACGGLLARILVGRSIEQARQITCKDILKILGGLPEGKEYYANLAEQALHSSIG